MGFGPSLGAWILRRLVLQAGLQVVVSNSDSESESDKDVDNFIGCLEKGKLGGGFLNMYIYYIYIFFFFDFPPLSPGERIQFDEYLLLHGLVKHHQSRKH